MASENQDDKKGIDLSIYGSKKPDKLYKGVYQRNGLGRWYAQCSSRGGNTSLGTYDTELEAALAYDKRARQLNRDESTLNFPRFLTGYNPSPAADSTLPIANPSASGVQDSEPSGSSSAINVGKGKKIKENITISKSEFDAHLPFHEARKRQFEYQRRQNVPQVHADNDASPATTSTLPPATSSVSGGAIESESANISSVQPDLMDFGNPGDLKDVPSSELLTDEDKEFVESLLNDGEKSDEDKPS